MTAIEAGILRHLGERPATGFELQKVLGTDANGYRDAVARLWNNHHLRGLPNDGCCNDPCGPACVSAFKQDRVWMLTSDGEAALQALPN